jgi:Tfp pilus assembly protein FimT
MTVIELVVVVALIGVMAGVVVPSVASLDRRSGDHRATDQIDALVRRARTIAVERATAVTVTLDPATNRFWLDPPESTAVLALPQGTSLISRAQRVHIRVASDGEASIDEALFVQREGATTPIVVRR